MYGLRFALVAALVAVTLAVAGCGGGDEESSGDTTTTTTSTETPTPAGTALKGSVGPGFEISLTTEDGTPVTTLSPGAYALEVEDLSSIHNFHLAGPGVDVSTSVGDEGTESFEIDLQAGEYTFVCDPHASSMNGSFEVG